MQNQYFSSGDITSIKNLDHQPRVAKSIMFKSLSDKSIINNTLGEKSFERQKFIPKSQLKSSQQLKETELVWKQREIESKKIDSHHTVQKRNEMDTLVTIAIIVLLFSLVCYLAPNQHYNPQK